MNDMESLRIDTNIPTLVDQVEDKLLAYLKDKKFQIGDPIPNEKMLCESLGVARTVLREALSRLKMLGLIQSHTRKGMFMSEPNMFNVLRRVVNPVIMGENSLFDLLGLRVSLEIGISSEIFRHITPRDLIELEKIVSNSTSGENNAYTPYNEYQFHTKLYEITGNRTISLFQEIIHPVMDFVKIHFQESLEPINIQLEEQGRIVTHADLLSFLKKGDLVGYKDAIETHFEVYRIFTDRRRSL